MFHSLYIHIPFCERKCFYCDFATSSFKLEKVFPYLEVLEKELAYYASCWKVPPLRTIYLGGGTPSLLSIDAFAYLFRVIRTHFALDDLVEWSVESSPGSLDLEKLRFLKQEGVNRLSLGVQSFQDGELEKLGRTHSASEAVRTYEQIREVGFENVSLDLIFAIPGQTQKSWEETLSQAISLKPDHFSLYNLILEEGTLFYRRHQRGELSLPGEDAEFFMYQTAREQLEAAGFKQYEISSFSVDGKQCRHNLAYWVSASYLGVGVGAHSFVGGERFANRRAWRAYMADWKNKEFITPLSREEEMKETLFMGFRLLSGVSKRAFLERFHVPIKAAFPKEIPELLLTGLLEENGERFYLSPKGVYLGNVVFEAFA